MPPVTWQTVTHTAFQYGSHPPHSQHAGQKDMCAIFKCIFPHRCADRTQPDGPQQSPLATGRPLVAPGRLRCVCPCSPSSPQGQSLPLLPRSPARWHHLSAARCAPSDRCAAPAGHRLCKSGGAQRWGRQCEGEPQADQQYSTVIVGGDRKPRH